ncbi:neutral zinc metallopeptidase [Defluviimonas sp. WL0002]|uniref:Neutral zinc metallopeptidase n=1 Tax=Albidovulum marisflavi TaxID=2984159 RepID=A0ABT2ZG14_9RHOB|nr:neutral zinc metallopeptidase [Defluviimonas sp. WL0002]MCV2870051.1 neutral zinc metallopeptidase [Defluviimonas sp. WL0002]
MRWRGRRQSNNIEDRRRMGRRGGTVQVGGLGLVAIVVIAYFLGVDVTPVLNEVSRQQGGGAVQGNTRLTEADVQAGEFVSVTLADTEEIWGRIFRVELGRTYDPPTLVLFKGLTQSPCATASAATGPFYCPADRKIYLDTDFFVTLGRQLGAQGDFAAAYVIAHEVAHHVQDELGILGQANAARQSAGQTASNAISVRIELQADCLSGIWARHAESVLGTIEDGDLSEALNAARKIGDDTLQRNAGRQPMPHTFTHGTSDQRERWFERGYQTGNVGDCDTFGATRL